MKIDKISNNNFKGIYRLPNTPKNLSEIDKYVGPMYERLKHEAFFPFVGKSPFGDGIRGLIDKIANKEGYSISWLRMNAENHGADFSGISEDYVNVVCGNKDFNNLLEFLKTRVNTKKSPLEKVKDFFFAPKENTYQDKPEHLRLLFVALDRLDAENSAFEEMFGSKIIEVKTTQELISKALKERD